MTRSTFVYVTYIRTTPEKLWSALTDDAEFMKQYWFGIHCESQWTVGSSWKMVYPDGRIVDTGEIVEADPPKRLVIRWQHQNKPELKAEGESRFPTFSGMRFGQVLESVEKFYSDYRNKNLLITLAFRFASDELSNKPPAEIEAELVSWRRVARENQ